MYASVRNGSVGLYNGGSVPIAVFGQGQKITRALVEGDTVYCETFYGKTLVYQISGSNVYMVNSY